MEIIYNLVDGKTLSYHVTAHASDGFQKESRGWKFPTAAVHQSGAPGGTRTHTVQILRLSPLPIGIQGPSHNLTILTQKNDFAKSLSSRRFAPYSNLDRNLSQSANRQHINIIQKQREGFHPNGRKPSYSLISQPLTETHLSRKHRRCGRRWNRCDPAGARPGRSSAQRSCRHR